MSSQMAPAAGLMLAATTSGSGKTLLTMGLLAALRKRGFALQPGKTGPDYIDPAFHTAVAGTASLTFDSFAMSAPSLHSLAQHAAGRHFVVEGVMGLFDGAASGRGSSYEVARILGLNLVLIVNVQGVSDTAAFIADGIRQHCRDVTFAGVILNQLGSPRHATQIERLLTDFGIPCLGRFYKDSELIIPSRHLGLIQADECVRSDNWHSFLTRLTDAVEAGLDVEALAALSARPKTDNYIPPAASLMPPPGQRIAIARDTAFGFAYEHIMQGWRDAGAEIIPFSPLADEAASQDADFIYLPGGYPELHLPALSAASVFQTSLRRAAERGCLIYGECGGYMVLGSAIYGADGTYWPMANLLHLTTSFAAPKRTLGYRFLDAATGPFAGQWTGHEYHVTQAIEETGIPLFSVTDSLGEDRGKAGLCAGSVYGSYMHLIAKTA